MEQRLNTKGYNFHMMAPDNWVLDDHSGTIYDGTFAAVLVFAVQRRGFKMANLELGVEMMLAKGEDSIHFGAFKTPIFSFNRKENKKVA